MRKQLKLLIALVNSAENGLGKCEKCGTRRTHWQYERSACAAMAELSLRYDRPA